MSDLIGFIKHPIGFIQHFIAKKKLAKSLEDEATEGFLEILLNLMKLAFWIDPGYRRNIVDFTGSYWLKDKDRKVNFLVRFHDGEMEISEDPDPDPAPYPKTKVTVTFKDSNALRRFLLDVKKDILQVILHNEVRVTGNLNYLYKFAFMANHPIHQLLKLENQLT